MDVVGNEKLKLTGSWLNGLSVAVFAAGVVIPVVNQLIGAVRLDNGYVAVLSGVCLTMTVAIHWFGTQLLGGLDVSD